MKFFAQVKKWAFSQRCDIHKNMFEFSVFLDTKNVAKIWLFNFFECFIFGVILEPKIRHTLFLGGPIFEGAYTRKKIYSALCLHIFHIPCKRKIMTKVFSIFLIPTKKRQKFVKRGHV